MNTIFLHADFRARPYRVEDFRDALEHQGALPDVIALGAYRMNHVWAVTLKNAEATRKMLSTGDIQVKNRRCLVVNPNDQGLRVKLHWLLYGVSDDAVREALAPYGKVTEVTKEKWRVRGITERASTTRVVAMKLRAGVTIDDLPHQLRVGNELALVVVPNRAPLCLRCNTTGHIRRDCRVPRCSQCRRFGHTDGECVTTYASIAGKAKKDEEAEHLMDEADAEQAASDVRKQTDEDAIHELGPTDAWKGVFAEENNTSQASGDPVTEKAHGEDKGNVVEAVLAEEAKADEQTMQVEPGACTKRPREDTGNEKDKTSASSGEEPPTKTVIKAGLQTGRRQSFKPKPTVPPDRKGEGTKPS